MFKRTIIVQNMILLEIAYMSRENGESNITKLNRTSREGKHPQNYLV